MHVSRNRRPADRHTTSTMSRGRSALLLEAERQPGSGQSSSVARIKEQAGRRRRSCSPRCTPAQSVLKIVRDELVRLNCSAARFRASSSPTNRPRVIMLVGLQGSGKTTHAAQARTFRAERTGPLPLALNCRRRLPPGGHRSTRDARSNRSTCRSMPATGAKTRSRSPPTERRCRGQAPLRGMSTEVIIEPRSVYLQIDDALMTELESLREGVRRTLPKRSSSSPTR